VPKKDLVQAKEYGQRKCFFPHVKSLLLDPSGFAAPPLGLPASGRDPQISKGLKVNRSPIEIEVTAVKILSFLPQEAAFRQTGLCFKCSVTTFVASPTVVPLTGKD
jgi:hypothetical protein